MMEPKKRWRSPLKTESQELVTKISWNSSSSEESEDEVKNPKKCKAYFPKIEYDMKLRVIIPMKRIKPHVRKKEEIQRVESNVSANISTFTSEENVIDFGSESPILKSNSIIACAQESDSPIISQNHLFRETSPVITDREIIKKIRSKRKEFINRSTKIDGSSPDIFLSQSSEIIEVNESPDRQTIVTTNISPDKGSIELVSSQDSSSIAIVEPTTSESSIPSSDLSNQCYHQPIPRRKHCKKNGLHHQLQKLLNLQKSRLSLWHHDIFCKNLVPSELEHIHGKINYKWKDFGCTLLKCFKDVPDNCDLEDIFLISLGYKSDTDLIYNVGQIIRIFPPFKEQLVQYENREVNMYYNVTKILTESEAKSSPGKQDEIVS